MALKVHEKAILDNYKDDLSSQKKLATKLKTTVINAQMRGVGTKKVEEGKNSLKELVPKKQIKSIRDDLVAHYSDLVLDAFVSKDGRDKLIEVVCKEQRYGDKEEGVAKGKYVVDEIVGFGFVDRIALDNTVTDIGWNGNFLSVQSNNKLQVLRPDQLNLEDPEKEIFTIIKKFSDYVGKPFSRNDPILDSVAGNLRLNAIHKVLSPAGTTMSLRIVKARLALTEENFVDFAPNFVLDFLKVITKTGCIAFIGGETGSGKTEFMKLMMSFIPKSDRIFLIEDVSETHIKEILPDHDIYALVTASGVTMSDLVGASLRNYPKWIVPSEVRDSTAYEMIEALRTGHSAISSLHGKNCRAFPRRLVTMSGMGYSINEDAVLEDVLTFADFGFHIKTAKIEIDPKNNVFYIIRYLSEIVEYSPEKTNTLFKQVLDNGTFYVTTGSLSDEFKERMGEKFIVYDLPKYEKEPVEKSSEVMEILKKAVSENEN